MRLASLKRKQGLRLRRQKRKKNMSWQGRKWLPTSFFFFSRRKSWGEGREMEWDIVSRLRGGWSWRDGGKVGKKEVEALEDEALERQESDKRAKEKKRLKKKWSIEVCDCFFHLWGLQGHWRHTHTHTHTHTHSLELIQVLIFSLKDIPSLCTGWKFIYCFSTWTTSFSPLALFPTVDKREIATKPITHLSSLQPGRSCWMPPSFRLCHLFSDCVCVCVCVHVPVRAC